jgi:hypothetical protein
MNQFGRVAALATILGGCFTLSLSAADPDTTAAGITYVPQQVSGPLFPPGRVKKALR